MATVVLGVALAASSARAECVIASDDPVDVTVQVEVGEEVLDVPLVARVEITARASDAWPTVARGSITVEGTIDPAARRFALRPSRSFLGIVHTGATAVGVVSVRLADARRGLAEVDVYVRGLGIIRLEGVACRDLVVADVDGSGPTSAPGAGAWPRRGRTSLRATRGGGRRAWLLVDAEAPPLDVVERARGWAHVVSRAPALELDAWIRDADLGTRAPRFESVLASFVAYGATLCTHSHPPSPTHARLRLGAPLHRDTERPAFARATSERSFVIWRPDAWPPADGWVAVAAAPSVSMHCPPIALARADDVVELDVYDRAGVRLRIDPRGREHVVLSVDGRAAETGVRPGDVVVRLGPDAVSGTRDLDRLGRALYEGTIAIGVRRDGVELELPAVRDAAEERLRERGPDEPTGLDF